jgi:hypothetical protein
MGEEEVRWTKQGEGTALDMEGSCARLASVSFPRHTTTLQVRLFFFFHDSFLIEEGVEGQRCIGRSRAAKC